MDEAAINHLAQKVDDEVKERFPGVVQRVAVLQYGDDPVIEPERTAGPADHRGGGK